MCVYVYQCERAYVCVCICKVKEKVRHSRIGSEGQGKRKCVVRWGVYGKSFAISLPPIAFSFQPIIALFFPPPFVIVCSFLSSSRCGPLLTMLFFLSRCGPPCSSSYSRSLFFPLRFFLSNSLVFLLFTRVKNILLNNYDIYFMIF